MSEGNSQQSPAAEDRATAMAHPTPPGSADTPMLDADSSDLDNTSLNSGSDEDVGDDDSIMFDMDGPPQTLAHMAELSAAEVAHLDEDEDDEEQDIFDDGVGSDAVPDSDSEDSSIYEELEELDSMTPTIKVEGAAEPKQASDQKFEHNDSNVKDSKSDVDISMYEDKEAKGAANVAVGEQALPLRPGSTAALPEAGQPSLFRRSFAELGKRKYHLLYQKTVNTTGITNYLVGPAGESYPAQPFISLADHTDRIRVSVLGLREAKKRIEEYLQGTEEFLRAAREKQKSAENAFRAELENSGISQELYDAYEAFCESLNMEFGHRGGFSITCNADHQKSYVKYDPDFELFKEHVDRPYNDCNFRCEATFERSRAGVDHVVEFWPIKALEPLSGTATTWGDQYPDLYKLASAAVRAGSEAAMEMLIALPDMNYTFNGGWLLEYQFEDKLANELVVAKRWRFRSAHKIDSPVDVGGKRRRVELLLRPENVH